MSAFTAFESASDELTTLVQGLEQERDNALLERLAHDPSQAGAYVLDRTMIHARRMLAALDATSRRGARGAEAAALLEAIEAYTAVASELALGAAGGSQFRRRADELLEACLGIVAHAHEGRAVPSTRERDAVTRAYNQLVDAANRGW